MGLFDWVMKGIGFESDDDENEHDEVNIEKPKRDIKNSLAIDLGISNLASCVDTNNNSFIIDGKYLKSLNRLYNKKK